jgi:hypothetical protein
MGRAIGFIGTIITLAAGMYIYSQQMKSSVAPTAGSESVVNITGVKNDLIGIANAERAHLAAEGKYCSLDELISGNYVGIHSERPPYVYAVETTSNGFRVTATRSSSGSPAQLWIDETMEVHSSE